jgi:hypothetical protein
MPADKGKPWFSSSALGASHYNSVGLDAGAKDKFFRVLKAGTGLHFSICERSDSLFCIAPAVIAAFPSEKGKSARVLSQVLRLRLTFASGLS